MNKLFLKKKPELFQGKKELNKNRTYFEGWYFKNIGDEYSISFIPGIHIDGKDKKAFIQVITNSSSYYVNYDIRDFEFSFKPFYIKIKNNYFSKEEILIDINDESQGLKIIGHIKYFESKNIKTNIFNPNIMGPFSYIPFMECNHAILCMKNSVCGNIMVNDENMIFRDGVGYIEKDWGISFPKDYIWCQANRFQNKNVSFMLSVANIPFLLFSFKGIICSLIIDDKEYRFATYNHSKIIKYELSDKSLNIVLKRGVYSLEINSLYKDGYKLLAPVKGKMSKYILESISEKITVTLKKHNKIIFSDISEKCGLEVVF